MKGMNVRRMLVGSLVLLSLFLGGCHQAVETASTESREKEKTYSVTESGTASTGGKVSGEKAFYHYSINEILPQCRSHFSKKEIDLGNDIIAAVHEGRKKLKVKDLDYDEVVRRWFAALVSNPIVNTTEIDTDNMKLIYNKKKKEHLRYVKQWESEVEKILNDNIKKSYNDLLKAAAIERYLAMSTEYSNEEYNHIEETGDSGEYETSALTVIMDHTGICNGYARAFAYLLIRWNLWALIIKNGRFPMALI